MSAATAAMPVADRTRHPFHTIEMIHEIPAAFRETLRRTGESITGSTARLADRRFLGFTGCGTASYSARLAERFARASEGALRSAFLDAFDLSRYAPHLDGTWALAGISHSGITKTTVDAVRAARTQGAFTLGITHFRDRPISSAADVTLVAGNGPDLSRCHTKCYVAGALAGALVALEWRAACGEERRSTIDALRHGLDSLPPLLDQVLRSTAGVCEELAVSISDRPSIGFFGGGPNVATALEAALKVRETSFLPAIGMETEEFLHGSWQSTDRESVVFVVATDGHAQARARDLAEAADLVGARTVALVSEGNRTLDGFADTVIELPRVDELLSPFVNIIPLYLFAYHSAVKRGHNPDLLRYLDPAYWGARQVVFPPGTH